MKYPTITNWVAFNVVNVKFDNKYKQSGCNSPKSERLN